MPTPEEIAAAEAAKGQEKLLTQAQVDAIVQDRLAREKSKYSDYDDLRKFKSEHERQLDEAKTKELESQKEYEKLKEIHVKKEQELTGIVTQKDLQITDMKISSSLMGEIVKQNAYVEESMALVKQQAVFDKEGNIRLKGRDANGLEVMDSVEEGIKKFLTQRPHLVKITQKSGGGTGSGGTGSGGIQGADDLNSINAELLQAMNARDAKRAGELRVKLTAALAAKGASRQ